MESKGVIFKVLPAVTGQSQRTGNPWMAQSFVLEVSQGDHGQYKRKQVFEIFGEERIKEAQLSEGLAVKVMFDLEAREHEGKWYNSAKAWKVEHIIPTAQGQQQPQQRPPQQQYQQRPPQQNVGYFQPTGQYPPQGGYFQQQQPGYPPQQGGYAPQQAYPPQQQYPPQGGGQDDLPF